MTDQDASAFEVTDDGLLVRDEETEQEFDEGARLTFDGDA